jgi:hypothetical protein
MLLDLKAPPPVFFHEFYGSLLKISKGLAIHDDLYAVTGINLVAVANLVIQ